MSVHVCAFACDSWLALKRGFVKLPWVKAVFMMQRRQEEKQTEENKWRARDMKGAQASKMHSERGGLKEASVCHIGKKCRTRSER